ncbi:glycoside hydrolase family 36 protein [Leifsonia shinshuensis]|uniref:Alpha-galactosidase n=1 Tax=Leifsonia shinshuensis TaxID=150026 RepID=A0A7G6YAC3_9MICO|nr:glycoside hydrolase family 36 protein [Leifsonia shinshuensis]QNE35438.1 alpha-galactosidase [Leifsonia shinshuensis]
MSAAPANVLALPHAEGKEFRVQWSDEQPAHWTVGALDDVDSLLRPSPLVELFTAAEQRARSSQSYIESAVGTRLRVIDTELTTEEATETLRVKQRDPITGLFVESSLTCWNGLSVVRITHRVVNDSGVPQVLTALATTIGVGHSEPQLDDLELAWASNEWLAENRWHVQPLRDLLPQLNLTFHDQDARGRFAVSSNGAWSSGAYLPVGILIDRSSSLAAGWQIESGAGWQWEVVQSRAGATVTMSGPTDLESHFARRLVPGESFESVPAAIAISTNHIEGVVGELTAYRRQITPKPAALPVIYNDFMNTLMGAATTETLTPLIDAAEEVGAEYFMIDAGWSGFGDWWDTVGEWRELEGRFEGGLRALTDRIRSKGMTPGLWLEPEVVGVLSPLAISLPEEAFFSRFGERIVEHNRYRLDLRHPAARRHLDETVDHLVETYGIGYFKLDYNINNGPGTDLGVIAPGDGLLGHIREFADWLADIQRRHPGLLLEHCSSGGMRLDYAVLRHAHILSTSDQQDFKLYPPVSASSPMTVLPEQCGNWAYPSAAMNDEETIFTLVSGLAGRLYLSGFLNELRPSQIGLVHSAVAFAKNRASWLQTTIPRWPLGLPDWDSPVVTLELDGDDDELLFVWNRDAEEQPIVIPGTSHLKCVFPADGDNAQQWATGKTDAGDLVLKAPSMSARVYSRRIDA